MQLKLRVSAFFIMVTSLSACSHPRVIAEAPENTWPEFSHAFIERFLSSHPTFAVSQGRHEYDGQLPDLSLETLAGEVEQLRRERVKALSFSGPSLSPSERLERETCLAAIDRELFWLTSAESPTTDPNFYSRFLSPKYYVSFAYAPLETRARAVIQFAGGVPAALEQVKKNLKLPLARSLLDHGLLVYRGYASYIGKDVVEAFSPVRDPALQAELAAVAKKAAEAYASFADWLQAARASAHERFALGEPRFQEMLLSNERVSSSISEIETAGREALKKAQDRLRQVCAKYAPGETMAACMRKAGDHKANGGSLEAARAILPRLKKYIQEKGFVTIPGEEVALVNASPPFLRWNTAFIDIPGAYEEKLPSTYYISPPNPAWTPQAQRDYVPGRGELTDISIHEVWPGHFLQFQHMHRARSRMQQLFGSYAFIEGWGLYAEELMSFEQGFEKSDLELRVGALKWDLIRSARLLSAIGLHTGKMTVEQSEALFREQAFADAGNAKEQALRGTFDPGYLNYTLGKLMILKLRADWGATRGIKKWGAQELREFHDQFLSYGAPPVPVVRRAMLGGGDHGSLF